MATPWGIGSPWGLVPYGSSPEELYTTLELLPIVGAAVEDLAIQADLVQEKTIAGTISTEVAL